MTGNCRLTVFLVGDVEIEKIFFRAELGREGKKMKAVFMIAALAAMLSTAALGWTAQNFTPDAPHTKCDAPEEAYCE